MNAAHHLILTAAGYSLARTRMGYATVVAADPIVQAMAAADDTAPTRAEWAAFFYSRYCRA